MKLSHLDEQGAARMVDVSAKPPSIRIATAEGYLICAPQTVQLLHEQALPKGDVLAVARIAAIQSAKRTADLIPLCHTLPLDQVEVQFDVKEDRILVRATARVSARTGVEMEALVAVSTACLTLYDMMKAVDKKMRIDGIRVVEKIKQ